MNRKTTAALAAAVLGITLLTGCADNDDDDDRCTPVVMFFGTDGHYHYGSATGKRVPASKVPQSAQKVPGYKGPKTSLNKPKAPSAPKAPAPRPVKVGR